MAPASTKAGAPAGKPASGGASASAATTTTTTTRAPKKAPRGLARAPTLLARAARLDATAPWEKDDLLDALFFMRTLAAIAVGVGFGVAGVTGGLPALGFGAAAAAGGLAWARAVGVEDDEAYGGQNALLCEGLAPGGMALFLVRERARGREGRGDGGPGRCFSLSPGGLRFLTPSLSFCVLTSSPLFPRLPAHSCAGSWCTLPRRSDR